MPESDKPTMPLCGKCSLARFGIWRRVSEGTHEQDILGCRRLTGEEWKEGWRNDHDGLGWFQRNCPILRVARVENEERVLCSC